MPRKQKQPHRRPLARKDVPKKKSVALVRAPRKKLPVVIERARELSPRVVTEGFMLDTIGLVTLKTSPEQEKILSREPDIAEVDVLPDGAAYLPHPVYTRWLNEAFGRGGWQLVPVSKPALIEHTVNVKYLLFVDGKPVALADGKQEYHPTNRNQDYGDVLEATRSNALRRASKHLGIALALWDKRWCARWRREHCVQVTVKGRKKDDNNQWIDSELTQWRRKDAEPLKGEVARGRVERPEPPQAEHDAIDEFISKPKRERFWRIARRVGRNQDAIKVWLKTSYGIANTSAIKNRDYDKIVKILEGPGELPVKTEGRAEPGREPGQEG
jgi:hypothetical protein